MKFAKINPCYTCGKKVLGIYAVEAEMFGTYTQPDGTVLRVCSDKCLKKLNLSKFKIVEEHPFFMEG